MDFNDLYSSHQIALMRADAAPSADRRRAHHAAAEAFATRIDAARARRGALRAAFGPLRPIAA